MNNNDIAIKINNICKLYRIGLKDEIHEDFASAFCSFLKSPLKNYRKYSSLYNFAAFELNPNNNSGNIPSDIIWALNNVSFEVKKGEVVGIIGRNGAGKSTLLKILSRITEPTGGCAEIHGRVSSLLEVGTGFHSELTGRENIYLNGTVLGMTKKEIDRKFDEIVQFSGINKFIDTPVKRYSSGMSVRLAFSVAAHLEPEILIIDEVLAVGDASFQKKCINKMEDISQQGRTVLFVSHNMTAVNRLCPRAIMLEEGRVIMDGPAHKTVGAYLKSGSEVTSSREWIDPEIGPGNDIARLCAVRVKTKDGQISEAIDIRKSVDIEMEYDIFESGYVLLPHYEVRNENGVLVFVTFDLDPEWRNRKRPVGHYVSKVRIPGNLLSEGMLFFDVWLITMEPIEVLFAERDAVSFQVIDSLEGNSARGDYAESMGGAVRPLLEWTTKYNK